MDFGFAFFIVWAMLGADQLELCTTFGRYAFGGMQKCNIRMSFCGEVTKFRVMHLFWWSITFFCSVALIFLKDLISSCLCEGQMPKHL
jgi:hypothetical protein